MGDDDVLALVSACNAHLATEDGTPITADSSFFKDILSRNVVLHNQTFPELMVQAYVGRYFMHSGERIIVSLANKRVRRREIYEEIRHTMLEMMLVVTMATLAYVLVKAEPPP